MIALWMLYCLAVGLLLSVAALAAERAMRAFRLPQRGVWAVAMVLMLALPAAARWMPRAPEPAPAAPSAERGEGMKVRLEELAGGAGAESMPRIDVARWDRALVIGWMGMSAAAVLALLAAWAVLERRRRGWRAAEVDGVPVLLSPSTGPAVIGLFRSRIVLPRWVVADASDDVRALLLEHEREHLRAGDPRLLAVGLAAVALMPWNPAAWYQLRRLRLAVEVDCDARVLARRADVRAYGTLLLEVGRRGAGGRLLAAAFSEPASFLERRIRIMTTPRERRPWLRAACFGAAALAMIVAACEAPGPVQPGPLGTSMQPVRTESGSQIVAVSSNVRISRAAIENAVRTHYPAVLNAAATDTATLMFVLAENGGIERHDRVQLRRMGGRPVDGGEIQQRWRQSTGISQADAERSVVDVVTFQPGQMGPGRVEVLWVRKLSEAELAVAMETRGERMRQPGPSQRKQEDPEWEITREQAREHVVRYFPQVVRGDATPQTVWIIADARGQVVAYGDDRNDEPLQRQSDDIDNVQVFRGENLTFNGHQVGLIYVRLKG